MNTNKEAVNNPIQPESKDVRRNEIVGEFTRNAAAHGYGSPKQYAEAIIADKCPEAAPMKADAREFLRACG